MTAEPLQEQQPRTKRFSTVSYGAEEEAYWTAFYSKRQLTDTCAIFASA